MIVDNHPELVVDSTSLHFDGIFGEYDNNLVRWMDYTVPLCNTTDFFHTVTTLISLHQLSPNLKTSFATHILDAKYEQDNIHNVAF